MRGSSTLAPARSGVDGTRSRALERGGPGASSEGQVAGQAVVDVGLGVLRQAERDRGVALRVEVDEQRAVARVRDARGQVHGGGGLAHAALLIGDGVDGAHERAKVAVGAVGRRSPVEGSPPNVRFLPSDRRPRATAGSAERTLARHARPPRVTPRGISTLRRRGGGGRGRRRRRNRAITSGSRPRRTAAASPARSSASDAGPLPGHEHAAGARRGAAYSASTASGARARAVTAS